MREEISFFKRDTFLSQCRRMSKSSPGRCEKIDIPKRGNSRISGEKAWHPLGEAKYVLVMTKDEARKVGRNQTIRDAKNLTRIYNR